MIEIKRFPKKRKRREKKEELDTIKSRLYYSLYILFLVFIIIIFRLFELQILEGEENRIKSEYNRIRHIRIQPQRGNIYDIKGRLIAGVKYSFDVYLNPENAVNFEKKMPEFLQIINETEINIRARLAIAKKQPRYLPILLKRDIDWVTLSRLEANLYKFPGVFIDISYTRSYPHGKLASHLIGYLGEISTDEIKKGLYPNSKIGDLVGKYGIEKALDDILSGEPGEKRIEVDARGRYVRMLSYKPPIPGSDVFLTIDLDLQKAAEEALENNVGAIVALDPRNGNILAMASSPSFDPSIFIRGVTSKEWKELNDPLTHPLQNKCIQGTYAPGSTFKPILTFAGLKEGIINEKTSVFCSGNFTFGNRNFRCWKEGGHGQTDLYKSLVESCDVYYYSLGLKLGVDKIAHYSNLFGLGEKTGINLPNEQQGLIPTSQWKKKQLKQKWFEGETVSLSIGQGYTLTTPLQIANMYAAIANNGYLYKPNYVYKIVHRNGNTTLHPKEGELIKKIDLPMKHFDLVRNALAGVVNDPRGTGKNAKVEGLFVAGKTGTAQVYTQKKRKESEKMPWHLRDHAWFASFAPANNPEIVVTVLVEHGGSGGTNAAPLAKKVLERWFHLQKPLPITNPPRDT